LFRAHFLRRLGGVANTEAIAWYVEEAQRLLEEQQRRAESLRTRGDRIAGFGALFLALIGGNAPKLLHEAHGGARTAIAVVLVLAALCLAVSVVVAVVGVNKRGPITTVSVGEIANYLTQPVLNAPDLWSIQVRALRTFKRATESAQEGANDALKSITVSLYALLVGLGLAAVSVGILIVELI
jgi:predicted PurR-regulated permease PerM